MSANAHEVVPLTSNVVSIETTPATIHLNFDEVSARLDELLADYDIVVTQDTVKDAKKLATELNQLKGEIETRRKEEVGKASVDIHAFETKMKTLSSKCESGRRQILDQVKTFEDKTRHKVFDLLVKYTLEQYEELGIDEEYRYTKLTDLILVSNLTDKGNLTKAAREAVEARVRECKADQDRVALRLAQLEARSYKAGLKAPITKEQVEPFLKFSEVDYLAQLDRLIKAEVIRQAETKKIEEEVDTEAVTQPVRETVLPAGHNQPKVGNVVFDVVVKLEVEASEHTEPEAVEEKLIELLQKAGIYKSLKSVKVTRAGD